MEFMVIIVLNISISCIVPESSCVSIIGKLERRNYPPSILTCKKSHRMSSITRTLHCTLSLDIEVSISFYCQKIRSGFRVRRLKFFFYFRISKEKFINDRRSCTPNIWLHVQHIIIIRIINRRLYLHDYRFSFLIACNHTREGYRHFLFYVLYISRLYLNSSIIID